MPVNIFVTAMIVFLSGAATVMAESPYQPDVLIVKSKPRGAHWGKSPFAQLKNSPLAAKIKSARPSFPQSEHWGSQQGGFPSDQYFTVRLAPGASLEDTMKELRALDTVESVQPDYILTDPNFAEPNDPKFNEQWYLDALKVPQAWATTAGKGVYVADVESGYDTDHPDLKNQFDLTKSHDYDPKTDNPDKVNDNKRSHGTPVCGLIAGEANNGLFGAGIAYEAKLIGSQMANTMQAASVESVWTVNTAKAILGSIQRGASVILIEKQIPSLLSSVERIQVIYDAIKAAVDAGIPVVVPAGNFSSDLATEAKQADTGSIMVGAVTRALGAASFSNYGSRVNVAAPGEEVYSIQENNSETNDFGGTSSASAITAGITALVRAANSSLSPREIRDILVGTGKPILPSGNSSLSWNMNMTMGWSAADHSAEVKNVGVLLQAGPAVERARNR